jgi:heme/copper-type cytochrome/quinol oxidase subunit 1
VNVTFFPMHLAGFLGMPRHVYTYPNVPALDTTNLVVTLGSFVLAISALVFVWNLLVSLRRGEPAPANPWDAASLEWATSSPPPPHNFDVVPVVRSRLPLWEAAHPERVPGLVHE